LWECDWVWSWSENFEPINIRGFCTGNTGRKSGDSYTYECNHPVSFSFAKGPDKQLYGLVYVGIYCTRGEGSWPHGENRAYFEVPANDDDSDPEKIILEHVVKAIKSEKDQKVAREVNKLRWQFWR
jgi:hypothetical protein